MSYASRCVRAVKLTVLVRRWQKTENSHGIPFQYICSERWIKTAENVPSPATMLRTALVLLAFSTALAQAYCTCGTGTTGEYPCCTNTRGWWKNHNSVNKDQDSAQYFEWPLCAGPLANGEASIIFGNVTALGVFDLPTQGDMCNQLGAQFVAATMNKCRGACADPEVDTALASAWTILSTSCPGIGNNHPQRAEANQIKDVLDAYNNGNLYGPGHCGGENPEECPQYDCDGGCTRTQGYWKTHNTYTKKRSAWSYLEGCPLTEDTILYGSLSYYDVLMTPPKGGEACLIAGKQYAAARLNIDCNGACIPPVFVEEALQCVSDILSGPYCPGLAPGLATLTDAQKAKRAELLMCARTLDAYNNGFLLGPGNCEYSEDIIDDGGGGNGNGNGKPVVEDLVMTPSDASNVSIATLVFAIAAFVCAGVAGFYAYMRMRGGKKMGGSAYNQMEGDDEDDY